MSEIHKSGFVTILGKPNAGKSTLLNQLLGQKLSIITPRAQTTRHRIFGIDSGDDYQIIYSDTPGVIRPRYKLHERMMDSVGTALEDADVLVLLLSAYETHDESSLMDMASRFSGPKLLLINKIDISQPQEVDMRMHMATSQMTFHENFKVSALKGQGVAEVKAAILSLLPKAPPYFDKEQVSDRPERFFVSEIIREKLFLLLYEELPYSTEVEVVQFEEDEEISRIHATIHVERKSQKGMIIGKGGLMLKQIGTEARRDIEVFLGQKVYLELFVKVSEGWKDNPTYLRGFGYR
ncbi:MAG: GTPase Era [Bacteroidetes bacterium]|nr:MAG: GTPase Era [Bacteroidota bacterium]